MKKKLDLIYRKLFENFGAQHWWPGETPFEVMVGAVLTQNTSWLNVEKAIANLKKAKALELKKLSSLTHKELAALIRPAGYYNIKAKRLKNFLRFLSQNSGKLSSLKTKQLRDKLLAVNGVGPETADSILLYALNRPAFVVDAYTKRILLRHKFIKEDAEYGQVQNLFMKNLKNEVKLFNEYHALLVRLGKEYCLKNKPRCGVCPLKDINYEL